MTFLEFLHQHPLCRVAVYLLAVLGCLTSIGVIVGTLLFSRMRSLR